jgi:chemotaxis signal transduction protein
LIGVVVDCVAEVVNLPAQAIEDTPDFRERLGTQ